LITPCDIGICINSYERVLPIDEKNLPTRELYVEESMTERNTSRGELTDASPPVEGLGRLASQNHKESPNSAAAKS
jgi:hypothetical protein